jgi:NAD(P)-dependent dehydrogenase (short-subunit alcohol dehydrogenase family)
MRPHRRNDDHGVVEGSELLAGDGSGARDGGLDMAGALGAFGYEGKRVLVVGGASGIGAATAQLVAELGAEVVVADYTEVPFDVAKSIQLDLRDKASVEAAVRACGGPIDALFSCAGLSSDGVEMMKVNVVGQRELIERLVGGGLMSKGSAIAMIASGAGVGWQQNLEIILELLDTTDVAAAEQWCEAHADICTYSFSKQVVVAYCARRAFEFLQHGVRINALCPSSTETPLAKRSAGWLEYGTDYREVVGLEVAKPIQQAYPLAFLCSDAADYMTGASLTIDGGVNAARTTGTFQPQIPTLLAPRD